MSEEHAHYSIILECDPRDSIFVVTVPVLPGCRTQGKTYEEAVKQGQEAIKGWIDAVRAWGDPVPPPRIYTDCAHEQAKSSTARVSHG